MGTRRWGPGRLPGLPVPPTPGTAVVAPPPPQQPPIAPASPSRPRLTCHLPDLVSAPGPLGCPPCPAVPCGVCSNSGRAAAGPRQCLWSEGRPRDHAVWANQASRLRGQPPERGLGQHVCVQRKVGLTSVPRARATRAWGSRGGRGCPGQQCQTPWCGQRAAGCRAGLRAVPRWAEPSLDKAVAVGRGLGVGQAPSRTGQRNGQPSVSTDGETLSGQGGGVGPCDHAGRRRVARTRPSARPRTLSRPPTVHQRHVPPTPRGQAPLPGQAAARTCGRPGPGQQERPASCFSPPSGVMSWAGTPFPTPDTPGRAQPPGSWMCWSPGGLDI